MAFWKPEHEQLLVTRWNEGWSGSEIAEELNKVIGPIPIVSGKNAGKGKAINRDMVIAKARRMKLQSRPSPLPQAAQK